MPTRVPKQAKKPRAKVTGRARFAQVLFLAAGILCIILLTHVQESRLFRVNLSAPVAVNVAANKGGPALPRNVGDVSTTHVASAFLKPHYSGQDGEGRRWDVEAVTAQQTGTVSVSTLLMAQVSATYADITSPTGPAASPLTFTAVSGTYVQAGNTLTLENNVVITGRNYVMHTPLVTAQLVSRTAVGQSGVLINGPAGSYDVSLTAQNFNVDQQAGRVTFTGNVQAHLTPITRK